MVTKRSGVAVIRTLVSMGGLLLCEPALALDSGFCFNVVKEYTAAVAAHPGPIPPIGCPDPPNPPCRRSPAPSRSQLSGEDLVLSSTISETYGTLAKARWRAYSRVDAFSAWTLLWEHETTDFEHTRNGEVVEFRAPGLQKGKEHYFQVGFCYLAWGTSQIGCDCWSTAPTYTSTQPWLDEKPRAPAGMCTYIQDTFSGPESNPKRDAQGSVPPAGEGDGLGPDAVWVDEYPGTPLFNGSRIRGDGNALIPLNGFACMKETVPSPDGYAKAKFTVATFMGGPGAPQNPDGYNFDVHTRLVAAGMIAKAFFAKLTYRWRGADNCPELRVGHFERTTGVPFLTELASKRICVGTCGVSGPTCECQESMPNLATTPVFLQIETLDKPLIPGVGLTAQLGWNCDSCTNEPCDISKCGSKCVVTINDDSSVAQALVGEVGVSGIDAHEGDYAVDVIEIGSKPPMSALCP